MRCNRERRELMAEMNMIPLIDISLILLIIFMVLTPALVQSQITVQLPQSSTGAKESADDSVITVEIQKDGRVSVLGKRIRVAQLEEELILRLARSSRKTVLVQADKSVPVDMVVRVFDTARKLGAARLGISVEDRIRQN
ncbi:MAG: biopolymer transporter ExbD [Elusimicrobiaceae bacterium]|nr:biopolymer transporter ExbD [Elusimicrobiaceae bacterium]